LTPPVPIFSFPDEPAWNEAVDAVEFAVEIGEYRGRVFVARRELRSMIGHTPTPEEATACVFMNLEHFERLAERRIRDRALDADADIHLTSRDLRRGDGSP